MDEHEWFDVEEGAPSKKNGREIIIFI